MTQDGGGVGGGGESTRYSHSLSFISSMFSSTISATDQVIYQILLAYTIKYIDLETSMSQWQKQDVSVSFYDLLNFELDIPHSVTIQH